MATPTPVDFMALEQLIVARLRDALPAHVHVLAAADLADLTVGTQPTPAVHVLYRTYRPTKDGPAMWEEFDQYWLTVVTVRNASTLNTAEAVRADAGPLMGAVIAAMGAWVPDLPGCKSLQLAAAPNAGFHAGFGYFPIGWRVGMKLRTNRAKQ